MCISWLLLILIVSMHGSTIKFINKWIHFPQHRILSFDRPCEGLIPRVEEFYRLRTCVCVCVCVCVCLCVCVSLSVVRFNNNSLNLQ